MLQTQCTSFSRQKSHVTSHSELAYYAVTDLRCKRHGRHAVTSCPQDGNFDKCVPCAQRSYSAESEIRVIIPFVCILHIESKEPSIILAVDSTLECIPTVWRIIMGGGRKTLQRQCVRDISSALKQVSSTPIYVTCSSLWRCSFNTFSACYVPLYMN